VGETPTDPTGTPTVALVAADGDAVQSGNATIVGSDSGRTTFAMNGVATLELITATWTATVAGVSRTETDTVEVVGGFLFTLAAGRASDSSLADTTKYPTADLEQARLEVETECEMICDRAFVPRYQRVVLNGSGAGDLLLAHSDDDRTAGDVRTIRSIKMADRADGTFTSFTVGELAAVQVTDDGRLVRVDGDVFIEGWRNVIVEYEYGLDAPPPDLRGANLLRLRSTLNRPRSGVQERATSYTAPEGGTYRMDQAGRYKVGIADVDGPYARYSRRPDAGPGDQGGADSPGRPAGRTLTFQPQRYSLFHR
jgi:hypothetical protein